MVLGSMPPSPFQICIPCSIGRAIRKTARTWNISRGGLCSCPIIIETRRRRELGFMGLKKTAVNSQAMSFQDDFVCSPPKDIRCMGLA